MGLVDYSDSESDSEAPQPNAKKPFQKIVDRSHPGKILVSLPQTAAADEPAGSEEPAAKRIKVGGNRFSGFGSFLPPPKAAGKPPPAQGIGGGKAAPRIGVHLKTSSEAAFSRDLGGGEDEEDGAQSNGSGLSLPPPKAQAQPSIPADQKPEEEVKLVGKPLMFKPLSVARKPGKKTAAKAGVGKTATAQQSRTSTPIAAPKEEVKEPPAKRKKVSLFSISDEPPTASTPVVDETSYEPLYDGYDDGANGVADDLDNYQYDQAPPSTSYHPTTTTSGAESLDTIADDLNLSAAARRELFGRGRSGAGASASKVVNFNMDREYQHNEELRAAGEQQTYNPVRAIAPGKHNLRQLVNAVQNQREALEENFAKNRETKNQAAGRYGWR
ncbi:putative mitotic checkpoint protein prcc protein [Phaeoacremonium minimum UCRPA7]|uniref:Putative mitotic checkpoint protein prcc protein n=1 Tax=Phaeoacremonium minimum (strain UCR-PA7) TaxID=1286976 RepID=R8BN06_PHAM7|nr:putative mitotic checkpoint protein prcc protein [Phaeoacremonium minimum UCRPA7]EOO00665.1 putative mitotic checkpoint protein prcc protein [Phaeoacremonium minimum UCRPA7]